MNIGPASRSGSKKERSGSGSGPGTDASPASARLSCRCARVRGERLRAERSWKLKKQTSWGVIMGHRRNSCTSGIAAVIRL